jgi:hypothetical protein
MFADPDILLTALYVELTDRIIVAGGFARRGPGRPPQVTDAELVCLAMAQVLLRHDDERHWLRAAPKLVGHLFPRLLAQSEYNERLKAAVPLMEAARRWIAEATPGSAELLRLMDGTPVPCGQSIVSAKRSDLAGYAGYGYCASHSSFYWGAKQPRPFPNWLRQRVEAVIWTLKNQLGLERHGGRVPAGLWTRVVQRLLALNAAIWFNWMIGAPVKRSLIAYDHV